MIRTLKTFFFFIFVLSILQKNNQLKKLCSSSRLNDADVSRVQELIQDAEVNVNFGADSLCYKKTPLMALCQSEVFTEPHFRCAKLLLQREDIDVNVEDCTETALLSFCRNGFCSYEKNVAKGLIETVRLLIGRGADVNASFNGMYHCDPNALFALFFDVGYLTLPHPELLDVVRLLIENGVDIHAVGSYGLRPSYILHLLSRYRWYSKDLVDIFRLLIQRGIDIHDGNGEKAVDIWLRHSISKLSEEDLAHYSEIKNLLS